MYRGIIISVLLFLMCSGCLADAFTQETYVDPDNENNQLILFRDGTYTWNQTNYHKSGDWIKEDGVLYLDTDSFFGDTRLIVSGDAVIWSNGALWNKD